MVPISVLTPLLPLHFLGPPQEAIKNRKSKETPSTTVILFFIIIYND